MESLFANLALGFGVALSVQNLLYCLLGVLLGTLIGVLPGIGPVATIAMLLPVTFTLNPTSALIMLAGIYYGAQYGGSTTAILVNIPGEGAGGEGLKAVSKTRCSRVGGGESWNCLRRKHCARGSVLALAP